MQHTLTLVTGENLPGSIDLVFLFVFFFSFYCRSLSKKLS